ncbi:hypothetical protein [Jiangella sp. DSM 45060]|uniref:hypothetical protein n=1 Tax=Jiangella sp. DSM 45060 TaxID=1798224 RepID=UPI00087CC12A|nr:hypothetical protein [Jiangella sp. DSM 45060]SDT48115.1 hypothetical protein SAMN04515669_4274 [Jiangella sp. DSM 45060]
MSDEVDNAYKLALGEQMPTLRGKASICSFAFFEAEDALEKEAWTSTTADTFSTALKDHHRTAGNAGENAGTAIENRYDGEPDKVASDDPRANWAG